MIDRLPLPSLALMPSWCSRLLCFQSSSDFVARDSSLRTRRKVILLFPPRDRDPTKALLRYKCPDIRTTLVLPGHVQTSMFSTVTHPTSRMYRFFFPSLQPLEVVKKIIASLDDRHSKTVYLPFYATLSPLSSLAPSFVRDLVQWVSVSDHSDSQGEVL